MARRAIERIRVQESGDHRIHPGRLAAESPRSPDQLDRRGSDAKRCWGRAAGQARSRIQSGRSRASESARSTTGSAATTPPPASGAPARRERLLDGVEFPPPSAARRTLGRPACSTAIRVPCKSRRRRRSVRTTDPAARRRAAAAPARKASCIRRRSMRAASDAVVDMPTPSRTRRRASQRRDERKHGRDMTVTWQVQRRDESGASPRRRCCGSPSATGPASRTGCR